MLSPSFPVVLPPTMGHLTHCVTPSVSVQNSVGLLLLKVPGNGAMACWQKSHSNG